MDVGRIESMYTIVVSFVILQGSGLNDEKCKKRGIFFAPVSTSASKKGGNA